ncbi:MAG: hypothetical protein DMF85_02850 [Acidobacteria bacterium]|nr:MAG: hypothetical protein DMF85_02850 [Acidobacteriota bacterium]
MLSFTPNHARPLADTAPCLAPRASGTPIIGQLNHVSLTVVLVFAILAAACSSPDRRYTLRGQITEVAPDHTQVTLKHEDIPGFMPAMTMAYFVTDPKELEGFAAGDLVTATIVVKVSTPYLTAIKRTGHAPVPEETPKPHAMDILQPGDTVPSVAMTDQSGKAIAFSDWRGQVLAVTFVYTRCPMPDFCPLMDRNFAAVQSAIARDPALRDRVRLVSVSFDPEHDTPAVLRAHARTLGADPRIWSFVTGAPDVIASLTEKFGVSTIRESDPAKTITHNLRTAVIDPAGRLVTVHTQNDWTPDALVQEIRAARDRR